MRLKSNGALDPTFGINGIVADPVGLIQLVNAPTDPAGYKIVSAGAGRYPGEPAADLSTYSLFSRFNSDGSLDTSFGTGGTTWILTGTDPGQSAPDQWYRTVVRDVKVDGNGRDRHHVRRNGDRARPNVDKLTGERR